MWVKLVTPALKAAEDIHLSGPRSTLIPIRWTVRQRLSEIESDLTSGNPSEKATPSHPDVESASITNADTNPISDALALPRSRSLSLSAPWAAAKHASMAKTDEDDDADLCVVCMARPSDFQLLPCRHDRFCRQCMVETVCTWRRPEAPSCPLCRGAFHTMVFLQ